MSARTPQRSSAVTLRLWLGCALSEVRPARLAVRGFLRAQGLAREQLAACELALVEACNNAIQYVSGVGPHQPIAVTVLCDRFAVELRVDDHTPGFEWPERAELPASERECGRGLFFIQVLMDRAHYLRGPETNRLIMRIVRKGRLKSSPKSRSSRGLPGRSRTQAGHEALIPTSPPRT